MNHTILKTCNSHFHWSNMWHQVNLFTSRNCIWWWLFLVSLIFNAMTEVKNIVDYKYAKVTNNRGIIVFSAWMWLLDYPRKTHDTRNEELHLFILISHLYMHPRQIFNTKLQSFIKGKNGKIILKSLKIESEIRITMYSV